MGNINSCFGGSAKTSITPSADLQTPSQRGPVQISKPPTSPSPTATNALFDGLKSSRSGAKPAIKATSPQAASGKLSSDKSMAFQEVINNAARPRLKITAENFRAGHISEQETTQPVANGSLFYHEVQHTNSGSCGIHAANAYLGKPAINAGKVSRESNKLLGADVLSADDIAADGADGLPLANAMGDMHKHETGDANKLKGILAKHESSIDRAMIGISGDGQNAHWVAFRKDTGGTWHFINSYPGQNKDSWNKLLADNPQPQLSPVVFMESFAKNSYSNYQMITPKSD
jgi:hypothetical protein